MLATLLAWLYISFLCWAWGILFLQLVRKTTKEASLFPHFSIVCLIGLSVITIIASTLSLFMPLGDWWIQFMFIIPASLIFFVKNVPYFFSSLRKELSLLHPSSSVLLMSLLLLILVMSTWTIVHPDTLGYHAQTMQWIEKYKAVPGLVHLHVRFGYQGLWFVDCALFDFSFTGKQGITFLNSTVIFWFLLFIINRIDHNFFNTGKRIYGLCWIGLLSLSLWSYTQVRLTATSASPDFIATIFVLAIIYMLLARGAIRLQANDWLVVALLSIVSVTIKLSVAPMLAIAFVALLNFLIRRKLKTFLFCVIIGMLAVSAFMARNIITSGYVIFPSTAIDIAHVDWKYSKDRTEQEKNYITAYAKKRGVVAKEEVDTVNDMGAMEWLPGWWEQRSAADKVIVLVFFACLIASIIFIKKIISEGSVALLILVTMIGGVVFWFLNAPDPRFGFGFIHGFIVEVLYLLLKEKQIRGQKNILISILIAIAAITFSYTVYRFINFFHPDQLTTPLGIPSSGYKTSDCDGIKINSPINAEFGVTPVPCTDLNCDNFTPRGKHIEPGFRAK
ncbi:MAG TPA: hypothetical protein VFP97_12305 [Chitinophagaceae bacterium]|nr:hypothetical protein [Chitinophagaceae bacterium]